MSANRCGFFPSSLPTFLLRSSIHLSQFPVHFALLSSLPHSLSFFPLSLNAKLCCFRLQLIFIIFNLPPAPSPPLPPSSSHSSSVNFFLHPLLPPSISPPLRPVLDRNICPFLPPITCSPCIRLLIRHYPEVEVKISAIYPLQAAASG